MRVRSKMLARSRDDVIYRAESRREKDVGTKYSANPRKSSRYIRFWISFRFIGDQMQGMESDLLPDWNLRMEDIWILSKPWNCKPWN